MTSADLPEILLRGAAAGVLLLLSVKFALRGRGFDAQRITALFALGTSAYVIISSPAMWNELGPVWIVLLILATMNSVFFWWAATSLFDDDFQWKAWRFVPAVAIGVILVLRLTSGVDAGRLVPSVVHQILMVAMMLHAVWLALQHRNEDLIEPRRRFRLAFALAVGVTGVVIAAAETILVDELPQWLTLLHAVVLTALVYGFGFWLLQPRNVFAGARASEIAAPRPETDLADQHDLDRLQVLMDEGVYRTDGLTVGALAEKVGVPEHRLRKLINGALGFRNFSAFLNARRIEDAKAILADPAKARRQILQIALDLGYGSIAPFNRAFKAAAGETPSDYRRRALGG